MQGLTVFWSVPGFLECGCLLELVQLQSVFKLFPRGSI
jgi:hypothetical protein